MLSEITDRYAIYYGDCCEIMPSIPDDSVHLSIYSPPFVGLYHYSSSERDMSNCRSRAEFFEHYRFLVEQIERVTMPGRLTAVHCADIPDGNGALFDLPGEIVRLHEQAGMRYVARHAVWKEPFRVRMRTMARGLAHRQVCDDASLCDSAAADYLLLFRKRGENKIPIVHPIGLLSYAGEREIPPQLLKFRGWAGPQIENSYSHWIWRQYASAFWDDVRIDRVVPFEAGKDPDDEKHVHPLQLDVIERVVILRSNADETVLTPFMGVGSEIYGALLNGRRAIGIELKESYYRQAQKNVQAALEGRLEHGKQELILPPDDGDGFALAEFAPNRWKQKRRAGGARERATVSPAMKSVV